MWKREEGLGFHSSAAAHLVPGDRVSLWLAVCRGGWADSLEGSKGPPSLPPQSHTLLSYVVLEIK